MDAITPLPLPERYEDAVLALEQIVQSMENGKMSLEESVQAFETGTALVQHCQTLLAQAEQTIQILTEQQTLEPFTPDA